MTNTSLYPYCSAYNTLGLLNDPLKSAVTQSMDVSEPFELRLLLSLKNDKNIFSYFYLYHVFFKSNDWLQAAVEGQDSVLEQLSLKIFWKKIIQGFLAVFLSWIVFFLLAFVGQHPFKTTPPGFILNAFHMKLIDHAGERKQEQYSANLTL